MAPVEQTADRILVAVSRTTAHIRIIGRGTLKMGPVFREFLAAAEDQGVAHAAVDLAECETLDSTMLGILAGLAMRLRRLGGGMRVGGLSPKTLTLFRTLGLDRIVEIGAGDVAAPDPGALKPLDRDAATRQADETILEAHEDLVEASADNLPRFRDVIEFMRDSVARRQAEGAPGA
jgi:anti-anti-sigma factor